MSENSKIEWTTHTFNPWIGCTKIAPGCTHCYAESFAKRYGKADWGPNGTRVKTSEAYWRKPLKWNREAAAYVKMLEDDQHGRADPVEIVAPRPRVFCASLADVFEDWHGPVLNSRGAQLMTKDGKINAIGDGTDIELDYDAKGLGLDDVRRNLFALIDATPNLDWLLLTKRPENVRRMWPRCPDCGYTLEDAALHCDHRICTEKGGRGWHRENVWLGTSVSDQATADAMIPELLKCRDLAPVLFVSYEPALGPVDFQRAVTLGCPNGTGPAGCRPGRDGTRAIQDSTEGGLWVECACSRLGGLSWIIAGGESGPHARPFDISWARSAIEQCRAAGVACFVKQLGLRPFETRIQYGNGPYGPAKEGEEDEPLMLKDKKGGDMAEWEEGLRVREFPEFVPLAGQEGSQ